MWTLRESGFNVFVSAVTEWDRIKHEYGVLEGGVRLAAESIARWTVDIGVKQDGMLSS